VNKRFQKSPYCKINTYILLKKLIKHFFSIAICLLCFHIGVAQDKPEKQDSIDANANDTTTAAGKGLFDVPIPHNADSGEISIAKKKAFLYGNAIVKYGDIELKAAIIEIDFESSIVTAYGREDTSTNKIVGKPEFKESNEEFTSDTIIYNLKTKKGIIRGIVSEVSEGFLHARMTKKHETGEIHLADGRFTTCDAEHPHYYFALTKAMVRPDNKIISGPLYVVIADVPLPIGLPFGYFPSKKGRASGFIIPQYGEDRRKGFFLSGGGYYFALSDHMDLGITGEIYTKGSWGTTVRSQYKKRYKYNGNLNFQMSNVVISEKGLEDYSKNQSYSLRWSHSQDPKANPYSSFSASVNFETSGHTDYNANNHNDLLRTQQSSSISFRKKWPNAPFNLTANMDARQNTKTHEVNMSLPVVSFNMDRIYPLQKKQAVGRPKWYEKLTLSYSSNMKNLINTKDSTLIEVLRPDSFKTAYQHRVPVSLPIKLGKFFTLSPNMNYSGMIYTKKLDRDYSDEFKRVVTDTVQRIQYLHQLESSVSLSFKPTLYGMFSFKPQWIKQRIHAIRHVMNPSVSFSYKPKSFIDDSKYREVQYQIDSLGNTDTYNPYQGFDLYGLPSGTKESGSVSFALDNNLEMKVKNRKDTTEEFTKVKIIDRLNFSTRYNIFADSLRWSPISFSASTRLLKSMNVNISGSFDQYGYDPENGRKVSHSLFSQTGQLARLTSIRLTTGYNFKPKTDKKGREIKHDEYYYDPYFGEMYYADFDIPWGLNVNYSFNWSSRFNSKTKKFEPTVNQSVTANGNVSLSDKWKINVRSGYDFRMNKFSNTSVSISRDLHCWAMDFNWIPFGRIQSYNFRIYIKSSVFEGVEYKIQEDERRYNY
jgi:lipopolysaccharide assembly outer membrane protein LptD (OstA)